MQIVSIHLTPDFPYYWHLTCVWSFVTVNESILIHCYSLIYILYLDFHSFKHKIIFPTRIHITLCICGFHICRFDQPQIRNILGGKFQELPKSKTGKRAHLVLCWIHGNKGMWGHTCSSLYANRGYKQILYHCILGIWASADFGTHSGPWSQSSADTEG